MDKKEHSTHIAISKKGAVSYAQFCEQSNEYFTNSRRGSWAVMFKKSDWYFLALIEG